MSDMAEESVQGVQKETDEHAVSDQKRSCKPLFTYDMLLEPMPNLSQPSSTLCRRGPLFVSCDRLLYDLYTKQKVKLACDCLVTGNVFVCVCVRVHARVWYAENVCACACVTSCVG